MEADILEIIKKNGFTTADTSVRKIRSAKFEKYFGNERETISGTTRLFGRIISDSGLYGSFSLSGSGQNLKKLKNSIIDVTRFNPISGELSEIAESMPKKAKNIKLNIYDPGYENIDSGDFSEIEERVEENCLNFPGLKLGSARLIKNELKYYFANTKGMKEKFRRTGFKLELDFYLKGNQVSVSRTSTHFLKIDYSRLVQRAYNLLGSLDNPSEPDYYDSGLIFSPEASSTILRLFSLNFTPGRIKKHRINFPRILNILDSKFIDFEPGSAPFDDEGVQASETFLIEKGVFGNPVTNIENSVDKKLLLTGNGFRKNDSEMIGTNFSNLFIKPTVIPVTKLFRGKGNKILVSLLKLKSREGRHYLFSGYGYIFRNGERGESVHFLISTTFKSFFLNIIKISKELRFFYFDFNIGSPYLLVDGRKKRGHDGIIEI